MICSCLKRMGANDKKQKLNVKMKSGENA